jgi:hypothetical protein
MSRSWGATPRPFRPRLGQAVRQKLSRRARGLSAREAAVLHQAALLHRVDVTEQNAAHAPCEFGSLTSCAVSAAHFDHPEFLRWEAVISGRPEPADPPLPFKHRKMWEFVFIVAAVEGFGLYRPGARGVGFGVGSEPLAAVFARGGLDVLATDQPAERGKAWASTSQLMRDMASLSHPHIVDDAELSRRASVRAVDMNELPADLGEFDFAWSSCVIEHLGSPRHGLDFIRNSCDFLKPGGISVHTTELELVPRDETMDYGHMAVYRPDDLLNFGERMRAEGFEISLNLHVPMDAPEDRFISLPYQSALEDSSHLKLNIGDSVSTSFGIVVRKPLEWSG